METVIKNLSKSKIEINVEQDPKELEAFLDGAAKNLSKDLEIKGFRKGNVPREIVERELGTSRLYEEAARLAIEQTYPKIIFEKEIETASGPELEVIKLAPGNTFLWKVQVSIMPGVALADYKKIAKEVSQKEVRVEEKEIDEAIDWFRESRAKLVTVDRPAQKSDRVEIDFEGRMNGLKLEGAESKNHPFILGKGKFMPGFENEIEGMKAGDVKEFSLKAPDDYYIVNLRGKIIDFKVKIDLVQKREISEANDEFAKSLGEFRDLGALKESLREGIIMEKNVKEKERRRLEIIEKVAQKSEVEIPVALVDKEVEKMIDELKNSLSSTGVNFEEYLVKIKKRQDDLRKEIRSQAEKRVKFALCLKEIAKKEDIKATEEEIKEKTDEFLKQFETLKEAKNSIDEKDLRWYATGIVKNEKVFKLLEAS